MEDADKVYLELSKDTQIAALRIRVAVLRARVEVLEKDYSETYDKMMALRSDLMKVTGITQEDAQAELRRRAKER